MKYLKQIKLLAILSILTAVKATREINVVFSSASGHNIRLTHEGHETVADLIANIQGYADGNRPLCVTLPGQEVPLHESMVLVDLPGDAVDAFFHRLVFDDGAHYVQSTDIERVDGFRERLAPGDFIYDSTRRCLPDDVYMDSIPSGNLYVRPFKQIMVKSSKHPDGLPVRITEQSTVASLLRNLEEMSFPALALLNVGADGTKQLLGESESVASFTEVEALEFSFTGEVGGSVVYCTFSSVSMETVGDLRLKFAVDHDRRMFFRPDNSPGDGYPVGPNEILAHLPAGHFSARNDFALNGIVEALSSGTNLTADSCREVLGYVVGT